MLCACGCGLPANPELGAFVDYHHAGRYERNGRRAVPLPPATEPGIRVAKRCPHCGRKIRGDVCSVSSCRAPDRINWKALSAAVGGNPDPYPVETTSADVTLSSPCSEEDTFRLRQRERGLVQVECGGCGGVAWQEPPCVVNGVEVLVVRCRVCDKKPCAECGERPKRWRQQYCAECWRQRKEIEMPATIAAPKIVDAHREWVIWECVGGYDVLPATYNGSPPKAMPRFKTLEEAIAERRAIWGDIGKETQTMAATAAKLCCKYCGEEIKLRPQDRNITRVTCGSKACGKKHINFLSSGKAKGARAVNGTPPAPVASNGPSFKSSAATEVQGEGVQQAPPAAGLDRPSVDVSARPPASGEHMAGPLGVDGPVLCGSPDNAGLPVAIPTQPPQQHNPIAYEVVLTRASSDPILRAVEALEAVPADKWPGIFEVLQARRDAQMAAKRAEEMLASLGVA